MSVFLLQFRGTWTQVSGSFNFIKVSHSLLAVNNKQNVNFLLTFCEFLVFTKYESLQFWNRFTIDSQASIFIVLQAKTPLTLIDWISKDVLINSFFLLSTNKFYNQYYKERTH